MSSFLSEHTAEFYLAPHAAEVFSSYATPAIPIYFWSTREGNRLAEKSFAGKRLRVVNIFARRPKIGELHEQIIAAKLNRELFVYANEADALGIPTLAGIPLISSLEQLKRDCPSRWFRIYRGCEADIEMAIILPGACVEKDATPHIRGPIGLEFLAEETVSAAVPLEWMQAIERLRALRGIARNGYFYGRYNPFHLLLVE